MFDFIGIAASVDYANMPGRSLPSCNWVSFQTADSLIKVLHGMLRTYLTIGLVIRDDLEVWYVSDYPRMFLGRFICVERVCVRFMCSSDLRPSGGHPFSSCSPFMASRLGSRGSPRWRIGWSSSFKRFTFFVDKHLMPDPATLPCRVTSLSCSYLDAQDSVSFTCRHLPSPPTPSSKGCDPGEYGLAF